MNLHSILIACFLLAFFGTGRAQVNPDVKEQPPKKDDHNHQHDRPPLGKPPEKIEWAAAKKLSWKDYKGKYDDTRKLPAMTFIATYYNHFQNKKGDSVHIEVVPIFYPTDSYIKSDLKTKAALENAQVLFDLYEVWARKLRKEFVVSQFQVATYSTYMQAMYKANLQARNSEILKFKTDTKDGKDAEKQKVWAAKIKKELTDLAAYNKKNIRVRIK